MAAKIDAPAAAVTAVPACRHSGSWEEASEPAHPFSILLVSRKERRAARTWPPRPFPLQTSWKIMQLADSNFQADLGGRKWRQAAAATPPTWPQAAVRPTSRFLFFPLSKKTILLFSSTGSPLLTGAGRIRDHPLVWVWDSRVQRVPGAPWERGARPDLSGAGGRAGSVGAPCQMASGEMRADAQPQRHKGPRVVGGHLGEAQKIGVLK